MTSNGLQWPLLIMASNDLEKCFNWLFAYQTKARNPVFDLIMISKDL